MSSKQNWLLHEFINKALDQFVDEISSEITGEDTMCTGFRKMQETVYNKKIGKQFAKAETMIVLESTPQKT